MEGVSFDEEKTLPRPALLNRPHGLAGAVVGFGLARTERGANAILLAFGLLVILGTAFLLARSSLFAKPAPFDESTLRSINEIRNGTRP